MTTILNASTSAGLIITPDTSGNIQLQYNGVAAPVFGVWRNGSQTISSSTWTKINFNTEEFDTANCFDSTTNYRFTPNVAGYYQFNAALYFNSSGSCTRGIIQLYKNGSAFKFGNYMPPITSDSLRGVAVLSTLVYANGTTDYFELYGFITATSPYFEEGQNQTYWNGCLLRGA
jgi:hypothetical protein